MTEKAGRRRAAEKAGREASGVPTGTVTFLFTDIEGSTALWENYPTQMDVALARHDEILRAAVEASGGYVFKTVGDACCAAFATAKEALEATLSAQRALLAEEWGETPVRVRTALHTGVAEERDGDYFGPPVNRVARLLSAGHGGQVLMSDATYNLVRDVLVHMERGAELRDLGEHRLKDLRYTERIFQLVVPDLPSEFPPLETHGLVTPTPGLATPTPPAGLPKGDAREEAVGSEEGRYERKSLMGSGGMAEVYLAHDELLDRDVALKVLRRQYADDEQFVERFEREAKNAASLSHPSIVAVHDRGKTRDGSYYIVMECMPGGTLKERIQKEGPLVPAQALELTAQVAEALEAAHRRGVIHRDIKPQNVLLTEEGEAKVADFGIARAASSSTMTKTGAVMGTAHYVSPEQALGQPASPRSDLYSLGVVLYEMLTGELPHDAETPVGIAMQHVSGQLRPPKEVNPNVPEGLNAVCVRLLAKDPKDRYQSAAELVADLERVRRGELPVTAARQEGTDTIVDGTVVDGAGIAAEPSSGDRPQQEEARVSPTSRETASEQQTPGPSRAPQGPPSRSNTTLLLLAAIVVLLVLLLGGGAMALAFGPGADWWGGSKNESASGDSPDREDAVAGREDSKGAASAEEDARLEDELRTAVEDYYEAVDRQNWDYTYDNLDSQTKQRYTRDEYVQKNRYLASVDPLAQSLPRIVSEISTSSPVEVELTQTFRSGLTRSRTTYFVREDDAWKHRFSQQDDDIFLPDASYEEFVRAKQSGS